MDISYLNRLNGILMLCDQASTQLDVHNWFHYLNALFRELSSLITDEEVNHIDKTRRNVKKLLDDHHNSNKRNPILMFNGNIDGNLYEGLHKYEIELRKHMKLYGLQHEMMSKAEEALN